ncbi:response regulator [Xanthobacter autotrophicus]|uniref:hybrid sensor histidine kinase/response regulator n=1 Tax=Xanthobacter TaxID=279 RepID=UPI0024AAFFEF|nr:PAS domain-containing sensor histidine kinase [Xanthobacter autotrophicus]MDI4663650.1 response regulator [Xanthobacter autotrophicus]
MSGERRTEKGAGGQAGRGRGGRGGVQAAGRITPLALALLAALAGGFAAGVVLGEGTNALLSALVAALAVVGAFELVLAVRRALAGGAPEDPLARAALAASGDAMAVVEDGERVVESNPAYLRMCRSGIDAPPVPERFLARIPGSQPMVGELLNAVAGATAATSAVAFATGPGGRRLEVSVHPLGSPRRVLWTLRMAEDLAAAGAAPAVVPTIDSAPAPAAGPVPGADLVAVWERVPAGLLQFCGGRVLAPNLTFCRMLGYALADWGPEGRDIREVVAPADLARLDLALASGAEATLSIALTRKDGGHLPALVRLAPAQPPAEGMVAAALPLDALAAFMPAREGGSGPTAATGAMAASPDLFFLNAPLALALVDPAGRIRAANAAFDRLFGRDAAGRPLASLVADAAGAEVLLAGALQPGEPPAPCEVTLAGPAGRSARLYAAALGAGGAGDIALAAIDTTEQKQLEVQFAESQKLQAVGHLAGGVAHDFNNMLTAIIGYCDLLLVKHRQSDPSFPDIMQIKQNANRAAGLVRQLLAFSRRQTLRPQVIELADVISDVSALLRRLIGERITLEVQHARELWPVKVDVNQFEQVIINLAVNARDAMPDGGTLTVRTANVPAAASASYGQRLPEGDYVLVEVADTGTGIPPEIMGKIFEPFFSTKEVGKGTGLGLSTVYGIVEQTGGTILAESELGRGTTFRVFLPRHTGAPEEEAPRPAEPEPKVADLTGQGRVLLVEDEDAVRAFASRALANRGYEVLSAASGVEALEVMEQAGSVDLVISDVVMPEMDGPTLLRELRARDPALKVIFISGYAEEAFARNLPPSERFSFLPKPFSLKQLVAAVSETLRA